MSEATTATQRASAPGLPSTALRARWARGLLLTLAAVCVLRAILIPALLPITRRSGAVWALGELAVRADCFLLLLLTATGLAFFLWLYRARSRQRWVAKEERGGAEVPAWRELSPTRSVLVWFIPYLQLTLPYWEIAALFGDEGSGPDDRPIHLGGWWASVLATVLVWSLLSGQEALNLSLDQQILLGSAWAALLALSALLTARWIAEFERRAARRSGRRGSVALLPND